MFRYLFSIIGHISYWPFSILCLFVFQAVGVHYAYAAVTPAYQHEIEAMDKCTNAFYVYADQDSGCNHFYATGWMGDTAALSFDSAHIAHRYAGSSCIQVKFTASGSNWSAIYWQDPENNWGTDKNGGYDLRGATKLTFYARGIKGGEKVEFFAGGIDGPYHDSFSKTSTGVIKLSKRWKRYTINLSSKNLSRVVGGFGFALNSPNNPKGASFQVDEVKYDLARPNTLRFLLSFETLPVTSSNMPDQYLKNTCFIYDNSLALLSFLARGSKDDLRRAKILADSFVWAQNNDRYYSDRRLRNAYMSGDLVDHHRGTARLPGWWDYSAQKWLEDSTQVSTSTGNLAWTMIALLQYHKKMGNKRYLQAAISLGEWIERETVDDRCSGGYTGGYAGSNPNANKVFWKSTEHATDLFVAFSLLHEITGQEKWAKRAQHARTFVEAMWDTAEKHFWTGTLDDGCEINKSNVPVDIQAWVFLAINDYRSALKWAESNCYTVADGFEGFDFNTDRDGVWPEGTAQMAVAYQAAKLQKKSNSLVKALRKIQAEGPNANGKGIIAATHDGLTTGFDWKYYSRLHIGGDCLVYIQRNAVQPILGNLDTIEEWEGRNRGLNDRSVGPDKLRAQS